MWVETHPTIAARLLPVSSRGVGGGHSGTTPEPFKQNSLLALPKLCVSGKVARATLFPEAEGAKKKCKQSWQEHYSRPSDVLFAHLFTAYRLVPG